MKRKDIERLASMDNSMITSCRIIERGFNEITFAVDDGLELPSEHLACYGSNSTIERFLETEQIEAKRNNVVACSFSKDKIADIGGSDALFKCIVECYGQHRPLVLSPDMIWLVINQTLAKHVNENPELFRHKIVRHDGIMDIIVETEDDLLSGKPDWYAIFDGFYKQIEQKTKNGIASTMLADFSTTTGNEKIASISTLMKGVQSYFRYQVCYFICGIPYITLKGTVDDWQKVIKKTAILNKFGLSSWRKWLTPILSEFVRAASGYPNLMFWKNIVRIYTPTYITTRRGCIPNDTKVDGWCVALFPYRKKGRLRYDECMAYQRMDSEMIRVGFMYNRIFPNGKIESHPMELWSGIVGVDEDSKTFALTPKIGWFIRKSDEENESLDRLKSADQYEGIELTIDEVPEILNKIHEFSDLTLKFTGKVSIPDWLFAKRIGKLTIKGDIDDEYKSFLKGKFDKVYINE